jgi:streptogramin lyase
MIGSRPALVAALAAALVACGATDHRSPSPAAGARSGAAAPRAGRPLPHRHPPPLALVTAESRNAVLAVDLHTGLVVRRVAVAGDLEDVAATTQIAVLVSPATRTVALVSVPALRVLALLHGFSAPHIAAITPDGRFAYVSDDAAGTVTPVRLAGAVRYPGLAIGAGAHHLAFSGDGATAWVALGETATTIVELDTRSPAYPRVVHRWDPGFTVHDLRFSPSGTAVWLGSATGRDVTVVGARSRAVLARIPVGPPPQHIAFGPGGAYLTSGYGGTIERVDPVSGRLLDRARSPYGSFELDTGDGYVVTSSLLRGTLAIFDSHLRLLRTESLAPATREVAVVR